MAHHRIPTLALMAALGLSVMVPLGAAQAAPGNDHHGYDNKPSATRDALWDGHERQEIHQFFGKHWSDGSSRNKPMPHGEQARKSVPPDVAREIHPGRPLPKNVGQPLPPGLAKKLPPHPGYERVMVGDNVVLINAVSRVIVDVLSTPH